MLSLLQSMAYVQFRLVQQHRESTTSAFFSMQPRNLRQLLLKLADDIETVANELKE